jgi:hypothetical protein
LLGYLSELLNWLLEGDSNGLFDRDLDGDLLGFFDGDSENNLDGDLK